MDEKDDLMARTMVENLSIGINPLTGRALPLSDCCANEVVQEALKAVLEHCSLESYASILERQRKEKEAAQKEKKERRKTQYPNTGKAWSRASFGMKPARLASRLAKPGVSAMRPPKASKMVTSRVV